MPSEKRERQRQNRLTGRTADLEAAKAAKRRKSTRNAVIVVGLVAAVVILLAAMNSGGDGDKSDVAAGGKGKATTTTSGPEGTTTSGPDEATTTTVAAGGGGGGGGGVGVTCNDTKPANPPSTKQYDKPGDAKLDPAKTYTATMATTCGTIVLEFDQKAAPKTVNAFVFLAREGFYDGLKFHRVSRDFVIQGGDPAGTGRGGPGYEFEDELPKDNDYPIGTLAMANAGPDTNGSQFFIVTGPNGPKVFTQNPNYNRFGKVTKGLDVAQKMEQGFLPPPDPQGDQDGPPTKDLYIFKVTITES